MLKCQILLAVLIAGTSVLADEPVVGSFIQLNRACAGRTEAEWLSDIQQMREVGISSLVVQWTAQPDIAYFPCELSYGEQSDTIDRILSAAAKENMRVHLGLHHDPDYWTAITGRDPVLFDYFLARVAANERVQTALLARYADCAAWVGYYIPDEIDDLTWRRPGKNAVMRNYVRLMCERLQANDKTRTISISAFFRSRTAPQVFVRNMRDIIDTSPVDRLMLQDGMGSGDPGEHYIPIYFKVFAREWDNPRTRLACVVETFRRTSPPNQPFTARPAPPAAVLNQIGRSAECFEEVFLFTFSDYIDPDLSPAAATLYEALRNARE